MRLTLCTLAVFSLVALTLSAPAQQQADAKQELARLQGVWVVTAAEAIGKPIPPDKGPKQIVISGDKLTGLGPEMIITLYPTKQPRWIDLTFAKDDQKYPVRAIYQVEGDELKLCFPVARVDKKFTNPRPESFDTAGKDVFLLKAKQASKGG